MAYSDTPLVSVITVCYNAAETIEKTIKSVLNQTYDNVQYIVVDGNSTDDTVTKVNSISENRLELISEPDRGIYDAINKGINASKGEVIHILNADDHYASADVLERIVTVFKNTDADVVYSGINYIDSNDRLLGTWQPKLFTRDSYRAGYHTPHPGYFASRRAYDRLGFYNIELKIAADFDLMLRMMEDRSISSTLFDDTTVLMRADGASSTIKGIWQGFGDIRYSLKTNGIKVNIIWYVCRRYLPKLSKKASRLLGHS